ncbi:MAG TPA: ribosomal protein S18-alanine N-acetyltransferase [Methanomicrobiales archaeon]|nr:ribosomal protein S18-alanine N-acetyltransferase [Methanomicrobiales archaeon]
MATRSIPSTSPVYIRRARPGDLPTICEIENQSFIEPWDPETFVLTLEWYHTSFFVAEYHSRIVGFLAGAVEDMDDGMYGHICNLAVAPECRKHGVGTKLVRRAEHQFALNGATGVILEVRASNTPAQRFYRRMGYSQAFRIAEYYADGEDALLMLKEMRF